MGKYNEAIKDYDKGIELDPQDAMAYRNRGSLYFELGNHDQAIKDYKIGARLGDKKAQDILKSKRIEW